MPKPAARITDDHACPKPSHIGGPITQPGEPTVLLGNVAAARYSDMAQCTGTAEPDNVSMGAPTVVIGKLLAGRLGESMEHGGNVVVGFPLVLIGDPPPSVTVVRRGKILIVVDRAAHTIMMVGVQEYHGDGASEEFIRRATASINKTWSGQTEFEGAPYQVDCMITGRPMGDPPNPLANQIEVVKTKDPPGVTANDDPAYQSAYGKRVGHQHSTDQDDGWLTAAHEFGHSMGLPDEYIEGPRVNGKRQLTHTGPPGGLMGYPTGSRPTPDNYGGLITGKGLL
jgi:uncharacterized Zn-binding protein involved in type VI secretion